MAKELKSEQPNAVLERFIQISKAQQNKEADLFAGQLYEDYDIKPIRKYAFVGV